LAIEGPASWKLENNVVPEARRNGPVRHAAAAVDRRTAPHANHGTAKIGEADVRQAAGNLAALRAAFSVCPIRPPRLDGAIALGVGPVFRRSSSFRRRVDFAGRLGQHGHAEGVGGEMNGFDDKIRCRSKGCRSIRSAAAIDETGEAAIDFTSTAGAPAGQRHPHRRRATFKTSRSGSSRSRPAWSLRRELDCGCAVEQPAQQLISRGDRYE
jgi:hypothetical protein